MGTKMEFVHKSVLLDEVIEGLKIKEDGVYIDGTLGGAGHAFEVCRRLSGNGRFIGIDRDMAAIEAGTERLKEFGNRVTIVHDNYLNMVSVAHGLGIDKVDGITLDLGVSSFQLDNASRGFSYRFDAPIDMRMDDTQKFCALDVINKYTEQELYRVIRDYGEERFAKNIAKNIVAEREKEPIVTTGKLVSLIERSIPMKSRKTGGHPAKRTFQAIRIEVNSELTILEECLRGMIDLLSPNGRLCVITFHSLEDRIVKKIMREEENPCICPPDFPVCTCGRRPKGKCIPRKPVLPSNEEMEANPRAKSAKLRIFQKFQKNFN